MQITKKLRAFNQFCINTFQSLFTTEAHSRGHVSLTHLPEAHSLWIHLTEHKLLLKKLRKCVPKKDLRPNQTPLLGCLIHCFPSLLLSVYSVSPAAVTLLLKAAHYGPPLEVKLPISLQIQRIHLLMIPRSATKMIYFMFIILFKTVQFFNYRHPTVLCIDDSALRHYYRVVRSSLSISSLLTHSQEKYPLMRWMSVC